jgi:hypothetical protein
MIFTFSSNTLAVDVWKFPFLPSFLRLLSTHWIDGDVGCDRKISMLNFKLKVAWGNAPFNNQPTHTNNHSLLVPNSSFVRDYKKDSPRKTSNQNERDLQHEEPLFKKK